MAEKIAFENGQISNFERLVTLIILTLNRVMMHTIVLHSSTSTYTLNLTEIERTLWMDGSMHVRTMHVLGTFARTDAILLDLRVGTFLEEEEKNRQTFETGFIYY